ncbi:TonB-dependent receptor [Croceibacterium soli]|nr:TonB-dependent receptor [Croceibacterium soli]
MIRIMLLSSVAFLPLSAVHAQGTTAQRAETAAPARPATRGDDDFHGEIVVRAGGLERLDMLAGTSVVEGIELQRHLDGQIGEVLTHLPGVSATSFSPGASRPVLRGFQGERVRVLVDGIGSIDASNTSADHAVTIDPLTADRIEVLRGPAVLLYGSSAIGGAVNVIDKRIPLRVPEEPIHVDGFAAIDSAYDLREGGASFDVPLSGTIALHLDGSYRKTDDLEVAGYTLAAPLRADLLADAAEEEEEGHLEEAEELREAANRRGVLPNSATETKSLGAGLAWIGSGGSLGVSAGYYDTAYGVPMRPGAGHHHHGEEEEGEEEGEEEHGEEAVTIGLEQFRADLRGSLALGGGLFEELTTRWGYSDYTHTEFEGDEVGTVFDVEGVEGRVELLQRDRGGWRGSIGAQYMHRDFSAVGAEAFVPPNTTDQIAVFALQEFDLAPVELELGGRYENTSVEAPTLGRERSFGTFSGALGLSYETPAGLRFGINGSRTERAPSAEELFAEGPHIATQQFERGNPDLRKEAAWGLEGYVRGTLGGTTFSAAVFHNWFDGFVYLQDTGLTEDELPVFQYLQDDARYFGVEAEASFPLWRGNGMSLVGDVQGDYIRATLDDGSPVPRIPPLSLLGGLELQSDRWDARAEVQWFDDQDRIASFETPTDGFAHTNLSLAWKPLRGGENVTVLLQANNVFDVDGRRHASFTKDFVPLAGRNVKLSVRLSL